MAELTGNNYQTAIDWHRAVVGGQDLILRRVSALEYLQLFCGYANGNHIEVYAKQQGSIDTIQYHVVDTFDNIDHVRIGNVLCTSISQTVNDLLSDIDNIDEQPLVEGLNCYFHTHNKNFDSLYIKPENRERFDRIRDWAIEYYDEV